jgi:hypothetical protein
MNITQAHNLTRSFLLASRRCMESRPLHHGQEEMLAIPGIVCLAISIEIGLKAIILSEGGSSSGHKLDKLFEKISDDTQNMIIQEVGLDQTQFAKSLSLASDTFVEWRYIYEQGYTQVDVQFLNNLANAIQKAAAKVKK